MFQESHSGVSWWFLQTSDLCRTIALFGERLFQLNLLFTCQHWDPPKHLQVENVESISHHFGTAKTCALQSSDPFKLKTTCPKIALAANSPTWRICLQIFCHFHILKLNEAKRVIGSAHPRFWNTHCQVEEIRFKFWDYFEKVANEPKEPVWQNILFQATKPAYAVKSPNILWKPRIQTHPCQSCILSGEWGLDGGGVGPAFCCLELPRHFWRCPYAFAVYQKVVSFRSILFALSATFWRSLKEMDDKNVDENLGEDHRPPADKHFCHHDLHIANFIQDFRNIIYWNIHKKAIWSDTVWIEDRRCDYSENQMWFIST